MFSDSVRSCTFVEDAVHTVYFSSHESNWNWDYVMAIIEYEDVFVLLKQTDIS